MCENCDGYGIVQHFIFGTPWDLRLLASLIVCAMCEGYGWVELGVGDA